ncbi:MAG: MerR family transcriptional regulator [Cyanobacteria bacterium J06597_1]
MDKELTIQQAAEMTGLSAHTLRYYERCQLIAPIERASSGHRRYSADDIRWIVFLTRLRLTGMPIRQMQAYAVLARQHPDALEQRRKLLEAHRQTVCEQIEKLQKNLAIIDWKIQHYADLEAQGKVNG